MLIILDLKPKQKLNLNPTINQAWAWHSSSSSLFHTLPNLSEIQIEYTRLVKICWIILVISTFVCSLSKQYSQSGDIYQFAQMGECWIILVIDGSFWWNNNSGDILHFTKSVGR